MHVYIVAAHAHAAEKRVLNVVLGRRSFVLAIKNFFDVQQSFFVMFALIDNANAIYLIFCVPC